MATKADNKNLSLWSMVDKTDPSATKQYQGAGGFRGTSIKSTYHVKKATEIFGPLGIGWGYQILEDRIDEGHAIAGKGADDKPFIHDNIVTKVHTLRIKLWFILDGQRGEVEHYGHTPFVYTNKYGPQTETEPAKKSLTDAIGKCLSMLGFSADVFSGDFDDNDYVEQAKTESAIKKAEDKEAEIIKRRAELSDYVVRHIDAIKSAQTPNETKGIEMSACRHLARQAMIPDLAKIAEKGQRAITQEAAAKTKEFDHETV